MPYGKIKFSSLFISAPGRRQSFIIRGVVSCLLFLVIFLPSCNLIQPPESIPSYIRVQSYTFLDSAVLGQGTASSHITDVWVDDNNDYRGMYQIPVSVPILATGPTTISLQAVVQENGIVSNLLPYPFYSIYKTSVNLRPGILDTVNPVFSYNSKITKFAWQAGNFEGTGSAINTLAPNTANCFVTSNKDSVFEGLRSYEVDMSTGHDTFNAVNSGTLFTPPVSYVVWLEMNYKTDVAMDVGLDMVDPASSTGGPHEFVSGVNPTSTWKKVYINLGSELQFFNQYPYFLIYFYAVGAGNAHIFIDNLKLLYLE